MSIGWLVVTIAAASCTPLSSPNTGPYGAPPSITDLSVVGPTVAGQPITVQADVATPGPVTTVDWEIKGPGGNMDRLDTYCTTADQTRNGSTSDFIATMTCMLPTSAPNGTWSVFLDVDGTNVHYDFDAVDFVLVGGHQVVNVLSQSIEPAVFPSGSKFTITATVSSEVWILNFWPPLYAIPTTPVPADGPPCTLSQPITPTNDGTWTYVCDSTGMVPGVYHVTAEWIPGGYTPAVATWEFEVT